jgi:hypothetical protein
MSIGQQVVLVASFASIRWVPVFAPPMGAAAMNDRPVDLVSSPEFGQQRLERSAARRRPAFAIAIVGDIGIT